LIEELDGLLAAIGLDDLVTALPQALRHQRPQRRLVINKQQVGSGAGAQGANILTQKV
jgi:hypothetical protein